jgi:hypothetical protein
MWFLQGLGNENDLYLVNVGSRCWEWKIRGKQLSSGLQQKYNVLPNVPPRNGVPYPPLFFVDRSITSNHQL